MRTPRLLILAVSSTTLLALAGPGAAEQRSAEQRADDADQHGTVLNVMPPGQSGTITATDLAKVLAGDPAGRVAVDGENAPRNFADQWEMYDALNRLAPDQIASADLTRYYKPATFGIAAEDVLKTETPKRGVRITWDSHGVPHIKGETYSAVTWGAGYAGTKDRMFLQDVLRHAGRARSSEFLGATESNIAMDQSVLRSSYYTEAEAQAQIDRVADENGAEGRKLKAAAEAYVAGINAAQAAMCPAGLPTGPNCPAEYAALGKTPKPWKLTDVVYIAGLVGGIFGKGGGAEYGNALLLQKLQKKFGAKQGKKVYEDLRGRDDPEAPTTTTARWRHGDGAPVDPARSGVALPDPQGAPQAPGSGAPIGGGDLPLPGLENLLTGDAAATGGRLDAPFGTVDLNAAAHGMSNAALIGGQHTADGHPIMVAGPQTGQFAPQLWTEMALEGPGFKARGVAFAGASLVVQVGRGADYAWSATSPGFDNVDTVAERLCEPDGSRPTVESEHYVKGGECVAMDKRAHTQTALPNVGAPGTPQRLSFQVLRTHHGIVQLRTTVDGEPVALTHERSTYHNEVGSLVGFSRMNNPDFVTDAASFQRAAHGIDYTFNWFYADSRDIAYFGSGLLPHRSRDTHLDLPRWGDAAYDWKSFLSFDEHLRQINPPTGRLVNWNNKPGVGPVHADDIWDQAPVHRSQALSERVERLTDRGGATPEQLVGAVQDAALADTRAAKTLPHLLDAVGDAPGAGLLRAWLADGALREDRDRDGSYSHQAAIALFDEWWESAPAGDAPRGEHAVARDVLGGGLGALVHAVPRALDDHPRAGNGSSWLGPPWYGWVNKDLRQSLGKPVRGEWSRVYCGDGSLADCREDLRTSLAAATDRALSAQGVSRVEDLAYDKHADATRAVAAGVVGVRPIDWQNRPTFQQVACFTSHR